ncbi:winged helix-turn-helix transcriptional regulator [Rufibacter hautae]|uniref:Helix-turn-helix transcriptional regulator n=1 Tax=Rufibacter hautae TaxID=2595005 RepID=A0A5B6TDJ7_9BACT|nr:helix-turn-helix domain-containing protein [Rufibacter hautae]KAA3437981.1 helix-turn-helix transcriptional regulator [Rufibacter hautae]
MEALIKEPVLKQDRNLCITHILPIRDALDILSGKWKIPIIVALCVHKRRFKELHRDVQGITAKMLSKELKELEMNKLVKRTVHDTSPVTVEYSITEYGHSLTPVINELRDWGMKHRDKIIYHPEEV